MTKVNTIRFKLTQRENLLRDKMDYYDDLPDGAFFAALERDGFDMQEVADLQKKIDNLNHE